MVHKANATFTLAVRSASGQQTFAFLKVEASKTPNVTEFYASSTFSLAKWALTYTHFV